LAQEFMQAARIRDAACLEMVCSRDEQLVPFSAARELFQHVARPDELAANAADILANESTAESRSERHGEFLDAATVRVFDKLCQAVLSRAERNTVVIWIDDVHHADVLSVRFFRYLALRARTARVLLVLGELSSHNWIYSRPRSEIGQMPHARTVVVGPLSSLGVSDLLAAAQAERIGLRGSEQHSAVFWAASGGNPLLAHALLSDFERSGPGPGADFGQALVSCLERMGPTTLRLACALAVLGTQATTALLARLLDVDVDQAALIAEAASRAGVADMSDGVRFHHPGVGEVLLRYVPSATKAELHHRAARVLYECGSDVGRVAGHLVKSGRAVDSWAIEVLTCAADRAMADGRAQAAAEFCELAMRSHVSGHARWKVVTGLVNALWHLAPEHAARHLDELIVAAEHEQLPCPDVIELAKLLLWRGRLDEAASLVARIQQPDAQQPDASAVHETELWLACVYPPLAKARRPGNQLAQGREPHTCHVRGVPFVAAGLSAALDEGPTDRTLTSAVHVLQQVCANLSASSSAECALLALLALVYADEIDSAQAWCDKISAKSIKAAYALTPLWKATIAAIRAEIAFCRGEFPDAAELATAALAYLTSDDWGVAVGVPLGCLITAKVRMGRDTEAAELLGTPLPDAMFSTRYGLHYLFARGQYRLAAGDEHAALTDFLTCRDLMRSWGREKPTPVQWRLAAAEVWYVQGNHRQARGLAKEQLAQARSAGPRTRGVALRLLAAAEHPSKRLPLLSESVELLKSCGDRFQLARTIAQLSHTHQASGSHARAQMELMRAVQLAEHCGAQPLHRELLDNCIDLGITPSEMVPQEAERLSSLTNAERRVAVLASHGYSNREIAKRLFVTASRVEQHLTRVYRKLTIKRRKDLAAVIRLDLTNTA
jgi:DNA-binding CsgD family transcriptional regulator/putative Ca2+/H+ antiporter (TMEM165/GDT1 family)